MLIVALGWLYVLAMVAITAPSVWLGLFIFIGGGVAPVLLLLYIAGGRIRRARRLHLERQSELRPDDAATGEANAGVMHVVDRDTNPTVNRAVTPASSSAHPVTPPATPVPPSGLSSDRGDTSKTAPNR